MGDKNFHIRGIDLALDLNDLNFKNESREILKMKVRNPSRNPQSNAQFKTLLTMNDLFLYLALNRWGFLC